MPISPADIQTKLLSMQDPGYRDFHSALMPTVPKDVVIGVRTPLLRAYEKELRGTGEAEAFLKALPHTYYEENNLHGLMINSIGEYPAALAAVEAFLPYVDNWATCDLLSPKAFKKCPEGLIGSIKGWLASGRTYTVRFGIEMLMSFYLDCGFSPEYPALVAAIRSEEYYVNMMIAWYFATALAKQYDTIIPYIEGKTLDRWTHNKTIQKAVESYRISDDKKAYLRTLKLK